VDNNAEKSKEIEAFELLLRSIIKFLEKEFKVKIKR